ncbi:hypothetical protein M8C21_009927, partial [Ambrosia artemisiifolia]
VSDQDLDDWQNSSASVPDALRHYYYQYLSSTAEAAEEKFSMLKKNESLLKENDKLKHERQSLLRSRDLAEAQVVTLKKSVESLQKDIKEKENLVQDLKQSVEQRQNEITSCKAEITSLKKHAEGAQPTQDMTSGDVAVRQTPSLESYKEEIQLLKKEIERLNAAKSVVAQPVGSINSVEEVLDRKDEVTNSSEDDMLPISTGNPSECSESTESQNETIQDINGTANNHEEFPKSDDNAVTDVIKNSSKDSVVIADNGLLSASSTPVEPDMENKVEEIMFQLVCDPSGVVVETTIKELVPALLKWGNKLDHILRVLLSHMLSSIECCPPLSGVEDSVESHFHVLGERERWTVDVLLRLLLELLPIVHQLSLETCPYPPLLNSVGASFPTPLLKKYAEGHVDWPTFEWLHDDCFPSLIQIVSLLPQKEDSLRNRISSFLLAVSKRFGDDYLTHIMLPVFLVAVGDDADLACFPLTSQSKVKALRPKNVGDARIARLCVLPLLLAGVLGSPSKHEVLTEYLRNLLVQSAEVEGQSAMHSFDVYNSVRFLCMFEEHHNLIFNVIWEMVVSSNMDLKVPYVDAKVASAHVLPALVTLGSEPNLHVLYASIDAFGTVAQNFKTDVIVDKIRVQMDAFLEDGSHEAILAVIRALLFHLSANQLPSSNMVRRRDRSNAFCEAIRALDATDLSPASVRDLLLPTIQNLLKDTDALDPAHKEALEIIVKDRSGGTFDAFSKVMGSQFALPTSMTSLFSEGGLLGKRDSVEIPPLTPPTNLAEQPKITPTPPPSAVEDTRFRRIMRGGLTDMLRGKPKNNDEPSTPQ